MAAVRFFCRQLWRLTGILAVYICLGGALGMALGAPKLAFHKARQGSFGCWPTPSTFGLLETHCATQVADTAWAMSVGFPRLALTLPAVFIAALYDTLRNGFPIRLEDVCRGTGILVVWLLMPCFGLWWWARRSRWIGCGVGLALAGEILYLAAME